MDMSAGRMGECRRELSLGRGSQIAPGGLVDNDSFRTLCRWLKLARNLEIIGRAWEIIMCKLADLPNQDGFKFFGIRNDNKIGNCIVVQDKTTQCHYVSGDISFCDLKGWIDTGTAEKHGIRANIQPTAASENAGK